LSGPAADDVEKLMEFHASKHGKVEVPKEVSDAASDNDGNVDSAA
jgi:hypothetical protein